MTDFLIIGQGLAGTALAWELTRRKKSILVFDQPGENRASYVAAGLFNPITGRAMTKTWKAELLFSHLQEFYSLAESTLGQPFFHPLPIYRPFISQEEMLQWKEKSKSEAVRDFVLKFHEAPMFSDQVINPFGGMEITQSGYLDVTLWMSAVREFLKRQGSYVEERFDELDLIVDSSVSYKEYKASAIIFCDGMAALRGKWFNWLPLKPLKGETLDVILEKRHDRIFNRGVYLVPAAGEYRYKVGSTYKHSPFLEGPTEEAREELTMKAAGLIQQPFEVIHQGWGIRPTTPDRRPLLGHHPANKNVIIFNGLGTKGVSLSPYFAHQLSDWLEG